MIPARKNFLGELLVFGICRRSVWQAFHSVNLRVVDTLPAPPSRLDAPVIFFSNHSSWWDGYLAHIILRQVYGLNPYLMMDEKQLKRYAFFSWAGCFGVNREDPREALKSLEYIAQELIKKPGNALWMFPQGEIIPQEKRPLRFQSGLSRLVKKMEKCYVYPVSFRFEFMREQFPIIYINIGSCMAIQPNQKLHSRHFTAELEEILTRDLDLLRADVLEGNFDNFVPIVSGKTSTDILVNRLINLLPLPRKKHK
jgi:1-acyl-sn-glycerol-3-phosphate acyltransferase